LKYEEPFGKLRVNSLRSTKTGDPCQRLAGAGRMFILKIKNQRAKLQIKNKKG
jgi:hypothetical protein